MHTGNFDLTVVYSWSATICQTSPIEAEGKGKPCPRREKKKKKKKTLTANPTEPINQQGLTQLGWQQP
jgi:hypothetical protein